MEQAFVGSDYNIEAYDDGTSGGDASSSLEDSSSSIFEDLSNDEDIGFLFNGNGGARDILMAFFIPAIALFIFIYGIGKALMGSSSNKSGLEREKGSPLLERHPPRRLSAGSVPGSRHHG